MNLKEQLTLDDIELMVDNIKSMINSIPEDDDEISHLRSYLAERVICEAALWGGKTHYESIGIIEEAKLTLRSNSIQVLREEDEE